MPRSSGTTPIAPTARAPGGETYYFVSYWVREDRWVPRESLIRMHPLAWLIEAKRETMNHVRLVSWQEIDRETYLTFHPQLAHVDDEFSEPTQPRLLPPGGGRRR